jgi:hypothetical protein
MKPVAAGYVSFVDVIQKDHGCNCVLALQFRQAKQ